MLVREHPGHGRAAFADRAFRVGDLVWQEEPLIKWQGNTHTNSSVLLAVNSFLEAVAAATPEVRRTIEQHFRAPEPGPGAHAAHLTRSFTKSRVMHQARLSPTLPRRCLASTKASRSPISLA